MKSIQTIRWTFRSIFMTTSGRSILLVLAGLFFLFGGLDAIAAPTPGTGADPLGEIGVVATDSITLIFNVIGALLVAVGLLMFIGAAVNIARGRSTAGDLMLMFVVAAALVLIGVAFVAFGITQVAAISGG